MTLNYSPQSSCFQSAVFHNSSSQSCGRMKINQVRVKSASLEKYIPLRHKGNEANERKITNHEVANMTSIDKKLRRPKSSSYVGKRDYIFTTNHPSCVPPQMYLHEDIRSLSSLLEKNTKRRRVKSADTVHRFGSKINLPQFMENSTSLKTDDLSIGQKQYLWGIAKCYSIKSLKDSRSRAVNNLLHREFSRIQICKDVDREERIRLQKEFEEYSTMLNKLMNGCAISPEKSFCKKVSNKKHSHASKVNEQNCIHGYNKDTTQQIQYDINANERMMSLADKENLTNQSMNGTPNDNNNNNNLFRMLCQEEHVVVEDIEKKERPRSAKFRKRMFIKQNELQATSEDNISMNSI